MEKIDFMKDPLAAMTAAFYADDGCFTLTFSDVKKARAWAQRFTWKKEREKSEAKKEARKTLAKTKLEEKDYEWIADRNARYDNLNEFCATREGATVTVMSFRKDTGIVGMSEFTVPTHEETVE